MNLLPRRYAVYRLLSQARRPAPVADLTLAPFSAAEVDRYFGEQGRLAMEFHWFLEQGFLGVLMLDGPRWAGYGWITCRHSPAPPHLAPWIPRSCPDWLFYVHTRERYRGRGVQKAVMAALTVIPERSGLVYGEVRIGNTPSRRAFLSLGFEPAGTLLRLQLPIPILGARQICWWDRQAAHPPLFPFPREEAS
jgi:GNAT superfamily N-acetyltransferase